MDDQQERLHFKIGYILGLVDGEGCYQMGHGGRGFFYPTLTISNTDPLITETVYLYLRELGVGAWIWSPKLHGKEKRPYKRVYVKGLRRMKNYLEKIGKYPHAKSEQANLLKKVCDYRLSMSPTGVGSEKEKIYKYESQIRKQLSDLNKRYKGAMSSETIRSASERNEDIVRPYTRV